MPELTDEEILQRLARVPYWFHTIPVTETISTPGEDPSGDKATWYELPEDMTGMRVLDVGCYEGFFSYECERRGADVVAVDVIPPGPSAGFHVLHELLDSKVEFHHANIYELTASAGSTSSCVSGSSTTSGIQCSASIGSMTWRTEHSSSKPRSATRG